MQMEDLKTPSLIVEGDRMKRNAEAVKARARELNVSLRPHVKTHKCIEIAKLQTAGTDGAIMVSTLAEARAFLRHGFRDITYGVPIEAGKFGEAFEIARSSDKFAVLTDDAPTAALLDVSARREDVKIDVYLKTDCGYHRCGVEPSDPKAVEIARKIDDAENLNFAGILTHAGHSYHAASPEDLLRVARQERDVMTGFADELRAGGIEVPAVSIGSTPTFSAIDNLDGVTEFRCGNYIFYDAFQASIGSCSFSDCALTVLTAIVHRDERRRKIVVDAGAIALSKDRGAVEFDAHCGYGRVLDLEGGELGLRVQTLSQEHGEISVEDDTLFETLKVGDRLRILANHSCLTAAQHEFYHILENGRVVDKWAIHRGW